MVAFDEMLPEASEPRRPYSAYDRWLKEQDPARLTQKMEDAERVFRKTGITFAVYGEQEASEHGGDSCPGRQRRRPWPA